MDITQVFLDEIRKIIAEELDKRQRGQPEPLPDNTTFTVEEAAEYLGVSRSFIYENRKKGNLPAMKIGNKILISKRNLDRMMEKEVG